MKGHKGTFGDDESVLKLDFVRGHMTVCACQNSTNFTQKESQQPSNQ